MAGQQGDRRTFGKAMMAMALAGAALGLGGCSTLAGSHDIVLSESHLTLLLAREFPMERKVLEVIDLSVANPQIHLLPETNRLGTELDVTATDRIFGNTAQAHVRLDYGLRFEPGDHSIRMVNVRVRELTLASGSNQLHGAAQRLGTLVAEDVLENRALYTMKPAQADEMDRLGLVASPIVVTAQGVTVHVAPSGR